MKIFLTGTAGFIGFHVAARLLNSGFEVVGLDNVNDYYDVTLKETRLRSLNHYSNFEFHKGDLTDATLLEELFRRNDFEIVIHLGAQAGVRYSLTHPRAYIDSNVTGTLNILECCRCSAVKHLIYASSSSVYGANTKQPFSTEDRTDSPVSLYAATKKSNELMCEAYVHLYKLRCTGLRFFTVYGPWGRPDMAYYKFADAISAGRAIDVYNFGRMKRDFTYIDDIVNAIQALVQFAEKPEGGEKKLHAIYNLGNNKPETLMHLIELLEKNLNREAVKNFLPMQMGDVVETYADISAAQHDLNFEPSTPLDAGIAKFVKWYSMWKGLSQ